MTGRSVERTDPRGASAAAITAILYGSSYVATAIALRGFTPLTVGMWRGAIGALALGLLIAAARSPAIRPQRLTRPAVARLAVLAVISGPAFIIAMNVAVSLAGASITAFVAGLYAVLGAVFAIPALGERPERSTLAALLLALLGAALLGEVHLGGDTALGVGVGLVAAILFGTFLVLSRRWSAGYGLPGPMIAMVAQGLSALVTAGLAFASGPLLPAVAPGVDAVAAVVWLGLAVSGLASALIVVATRRLPARTTSSFLLLNPPTAAVLSFLLLGERLSGPQLLGALLILGAMAVTSGLLTRAPGREWRRR